MGKYALAADELSVIDNWEFETDSTIRLNLDSAFYAVNYLVQYHYDPDLINNFRLYILFSKNLKKEAISLYRSGQYKSSLQFISGH